MTMIQISWHGARGGCHTPDDTDRARLAAEAVLNAAGVTDYAALFREVCEAIEECREAPPIWWDAEIAAQRAGIAGWANPRDVVISISV